MVDTNIQDLREWAKEHTDLQFDSIGQFAELFIHKIFRLYREILGPYHVDSERFEKTYSIYQDGKLLNKVKSSRFKKSVTPPEVINLERFYSKEYLFWGHYFKKWSNDSKRRKFWEEESGMRFYADYISGIDKNGEKVTSLKKMSDKIISAVDKNIETEIIKLYEERGIQSALCYDAFFLTNFLRNLHTIARKSQGKKSCRKKSKKRLPPKVADPTKVETDHRTRGDLERGINLYYKTEHRYLAPQLKHICRLRIWFIRYFAKTRTEDKGWNLDQAYHKSSIPLITAEVCGAMMKSGIGEKRGLISDALNCLVKSCQENKFWQTTRTPKPQESYHANGFATVCLIKGLGPDEPIVKSCVNHIQNTINDLNLNDMHSFYVYTHYIRALSTMAAKGGGNQQLLDDLRIQKNRLLKASENLSCYFGVNNEDPNIVKDSLKYQILIAAQTLIAISHTEKALGEYDEPLRKRFTDILIANPQKAYKNHLELKNSFNKNDFTFWLKPIVIDALSRQKFVDNLLIISMIRDLIAHLYLWSGVSYKGKNGRRFIWADAHFLYAVGSVLEFFKEQPIYKTYLDATKVSSFI